MRDQPNSTLSAPSVPTAPPPPLPPLPPGKVPVPAPPPGWEDTTGFRETFLVLLEPVMAGAYRAVGRHLHDLACSEGGAGSAESFTRTTLRAILADLRHSEGLLAHVARELTASELAPDDSELASFAGRIALEVHWTADAIEKEIGPPPPPPSGPVAPQPAEGLG